MSAVNSCYIATNAFLHYALKDALALLKVPLAIDAETAAIVLDCSLENGLLRTVLFDKCGRTSTRSELITDKGEVRRKAVKSAVLLLAEYSTTAIDKWGILRGVRPTKLAVQLAEHYGEAEARRILAEDCLLANEAVEMLLEVSDNEKRFIQTAQLQEESACLYIGVPFCPTRCNYCSFPSFPVPEYQFVKEFIAAVKLELMLVADIADRLHKKVVAVYVGGGTPASLPREDFAELLSSVRECFPESREFTVECGRPELITAAMIDDLNRAAVSRMCINPQSLNDSTLRNIGRGHTVKDIYSAFALARQKFSGQINMDVIAGLPGETESEFENTIKQIIMFQPESVTVHSLALKRGSKLFVNGSLNDASQVEAMLEYAYIACKRKNYLPYYLYRQKNSIGENIGYCLPGSQCLYNIMIIEERHTIFGVGPAAATKMVFDKHLKSVYNPKDYRAYIRNINYHLNKKAALFLTE